MILSKLKVEKLMRCIEGFYDPEIVECKDCSLHDLCIKGRRYFSACETAWYYMGEYEDQKARGNIAEHNAKTISEDRDKWRAAAEKWERIADDLYDNIGNPIPGERDEQLVAIKAYEKAKEELK